LLLGVFGWQGRILATIRLAHEYDLVVVDACFTRPAVELARRTAPRDGLSSRELEILSLARNGHRSEEIGKMLHLTPHTVELHFRNANAKLGARSRTQSVARAIFLGLIPSGETAFGRRLKPSPFGRVQREVADAPSCSVRARTAIGRWTAARQKWPGTLRIAFDSGKAAALGSD